MSAYEAEGWKFGFDMSLANHFTRAVSPDGKVTDGSALFPSPAVEESFLALSTLNTEEEKRNMRTSNLSNRLGSHFWYNWGTNSDGTGKSMYDNDMLVEAEFGNGSEPERLWFAHGDKLGPNGEPNNGYRYLSAFDAQGHHLWDRLLEVKRLVITAFNREGDKVADRIWVSDEDPGCGTPAYPWLAS